MLVSIDSSSLTPDRPLPTRRWRFYIQSWSRQVLSCWMPSLPSCASFPTATGAPLRMQRMRRRLMDPAPRGRAYRVKVTVIEEPAQPEAFRVSVTLRGAWGFRVYRGGFVIGPAGLIVRPRVAGETDRNEPASAKDRRQHVRVTRMAQGTWRHRQEDHVATRGYRRRRMLCASLTRRTVRTRRPAVEPLPIS